MKYNILYCFDSNYNLQAFSSISSFLDKTSEKLNIHIIHKDESTMDFLPNYIKSHNMLNNAYVYQFNSKRSFFPNLENVHVSEATYYRIYFSDYISNEIDFLIYLDSDFICNSDPHSKLIESINLVYKSENVIGAVTQNVKDDSNEKLFDDIKMKSSRYFNAGMLLIDVKKWQEQDITKKMLFKLDNLDFDLKFWDQDLFNHIIDGKYTELSKKLNFQMKLEEISHTYHSNDHNPPIFFHFLGKQKPWTGKGLLAINSEIYQREFRKHSKDFYHIEHRWIINSIKILFNSVFNLQFFKIQNKKQFLLLFFRSYYAKRKLS